MKRKNSRKLHKIREREEFEQRKRAIIEQYRVGLDDSKILTFTKKWTPRLIILSSVWVTWIIAIIMFSGFLKLSDTAVTALGTLGGLVITEIIVVVWRYLDKSYKGKKSEEETKLEYEKLKLGNVVDNVVDTVSDIVSEREG